MSVCSLTPTFISSTLIQKGYGTENLRSGDPDPFDPLLKAYEKCRFKFMFWKGLRRPWAARGQKQFFSKVVFPKIKFGALLRVP